MEINILTNFNNFDNVDINNVQLNVTTCPTRPSGIGEVIMLFFKSMKYDYIILNNGSSKLIFLLSLLKWLFPFHRKKIVVVDILLPTGKRPKDKIKKIILSLLLKKVHMIMLYYRNTEGLEKAFSLPHSKFQYIPFKINQIDFLRTQTPVDEGYIFCGGKTRRDFDTLFKAVKELNIPVKLVTTDNSDIAQHGSHLNMNAVPDNVETIILDGSYESFISLMARSKFVVMPIIPAITGAGIGVYIMAMALKKCVIISSGPGAEDTIPEGAAVIVPTRDPTALRNAIEKVYNDSAFRESVANKGYEYASPLGGEENLYRSIIITLVDDYQRAIR